LGGMIDFRYHAGFPAASNILKKEVVK